MSESERFIPSGCAECPTCRTIVHERRLADATRNRATDPYLDTSTTSKARNATLRRLRADVDATRNRAAERLERIRTRRELAGWLRREADRLEADDA